MSIQYTKTSDTGFKKVETIQEVKEQEYSLEYLKDQELSIVTSINDFVSSKKAELVEIRALIAKADELGVKAKAKVIEEQVEEAEVKLPTTDIK